MLVGYFLESLVLNVSNWFIFKLPQNICKKILLDILIHFIKGNLIIII